MARKIVLTTLTCERCGHKWIARKLVVTICPRCKSEKWNEPRREEHAAK